MPRGRKPKTPKNSPRRPADVIKLNDLVPTSDLTPNALDEFLRLASRLESEGRLDRVDIAVVTNCARTKALLDRAHSDLDDPLGKLDQDKLRMATVLEGKVAMWMRALGLTVLPSRSVVKTVAKDPAAADPMKSLIKLA